MSRQASVCWAYMVFGWQDWEISLVKCALGSGKMWNHIVHQWKWDEYHKTLLFFRSIFRTNIDMCTINMLHIIMNCCNNYKTNVYFKF
ncbi:hypothetical protein DXC86_14815 [Bacteroides fragilis]|uniref:Uncharacterized protein n=2 Tax=Bacteroides fragilis TaxID=817 RepID=O06964_BACFG|nr:orf1 [Bacteroides fragilis]AAC38326.1 unknown [Bacteroides fragilis]EXZ47151.1 hypothetical protein M109_4092 [Bacteroides fragilis str. 3397 N2]RGL01562.1 hypothetical protein DXC86_14815 [Bacteroides fragilis]RHD48696.1 hypothetical protein DW791_12460 [Bacteroides fragilis]